MSYEFKGTPSPWTLSNGNLLYCNGRRFYDNYTITKEFDRSYDGKNNIHIADVRNPFLDRPELNPVTVDEARNNAILISSAPELLEALTSLIQNPHFNLWDLANREAIDNLDTYACLNKLKDAIENADKVVQKALNIPSSKNSDLYRG